MHLNSNFLEKFYDSITEWTRDEEAKYQAGLVTKEVETFKSDSDQTTSTVKSPTHSRPSSSRKSSASTERKKKAAANTAVEFKPDVDYIHDNFVAQSSLKAWKMEQEKLGMLSDRTAKGGKKSPKSPRSPKTKSPVSVPEPAAKGARYGSATTKPGGSRMNSSVSPSPKSGGKRTSNNSPSKVF